MQRSGGADVTINLRIDCGTTTGTASAKTVSTDWERFPVTQVCGATSGNAKFLIINGTSAVRAWGGQLEDVTDEPETDAGIYVKTSATAVSTASRGVVSDTDLRVAEAQNVTFQGFSNFVTQLPIQFEGSTVDDNETTLTVVNPTADRTITLPNVDGTVITNGDSGTITAGMLKAVDTAADEECLTRETTTGDFEWQTCGAGVSGYATIQEEGTGVTQQTTFNFLGAAVTAANDGANNRTNITIAEVDP